MKENEFTADQVYLLIKKLVGEIEPYADASIDRDRFKSAELFLDIFHKMYLDACYVAARYRNSPYSSARKIGDYFDKYLENIHEDYTN